MLKHHIMEGRTRIVRGRGGFIENAYFIPLHGDRGMRASAGIDGAAAREDERKSEKEKVFHMRDW
jgi:hypothetical protein